MKKKYLISIKVIVSILAIIILFIAVKILNMTAKYDYSREYLRPRVSDSPIYYECHKGEAVNISLVANEDIEASGLEILLVNLSKEDEGTINVVILDSENNVIFENNKTIDDIKVGDFTTFEGNFSLHADKEYMIVFLADESEPYFATVPIGGMEGLPFSMGENVAIGVVKAEPIVVTYSDIFYWSLPIIVVMLIVFLTLVWIGTDRFLAVANKCINIISLALSVWGNEIFLMIVFITSCFGIYVHAYADEICITSDSAGYLREAVNILAGNGMNYDGVAGYNSWFANWPILYPFMIAIIAAILGQEVYFASKLLMMIIIGAILISFRVAFKKKAWIYSLCLLNLGFMELSYYTWSEVLFIFCLIHAGLSLGNIVSKNSIEIKNYIYFSLSVFFAFLTRYFGIFLFFVGGIYALMYLVEGLVKKNKLSLKKSVYLIVSEGVTGIICLSYLINNKIQNGMPSGVSRTDWWDDYQNLTNDLIESLLKEFFNVFHIEIPELIEGYDYSLKAILLLLILAGVSILVLRRFKRKQSYNVFLLMSVVYYAMFIVIRYFSSMDTFYFRFFEPSTFILSMGLLGLLIDRHGDLKEWYIPFAGIAISIIMIFSDIDMYQDGYFADKEPYYSIVTRGWDNNYALIPNRSVVIFSDFDYRSEFYRADVVSGELFTSDTVASLRERYYGSDYLCIQTEYAKEMIACGEYQDEVSDMLSYGLAMASDGDKYMSVRLNN